jgi:hypothetical protein
MLAWLRAKAGSRELKGFGLVITKNPQVFLLLPALFAARKSD